MDLTRKLSFLVFVLCVLISLKNHNNAQTNKPSSSPYSSSSPPMFIPIKVEKTYEEALDDSQRLQYDFYRQTCPKAEQIIRLTLRDLHRLRPDVAPALLRLVFHDCFIEGCDASVLLDTAGGLESEKDSVPNQSLRGFDVIDIIKSELEKECPGTVSCADILVVAARESVVLSGGPFYPLHTGRRDSIQSYYQIANLELPNPHDDLSSALDSFASRGFDERETVTLLGAHSTGVIHCKFFRERLSNFSGTDGPDPTMDNEFVNFLRSRCNISDTSASPPSSSLSPPPSALSSESQSLSPSPSSFWSVKNVSSLADSLFQDTGMKMDYEGPGRGFGTLYYRSLLQGKGLLYVDQQLTTGEETTTWVKAYASDISLFQRDFALAMMKLSDYRVVTAPSGEVRLNCRMLVS